MKGLLSRSFFGVAVTGLAGLAFAAPARAAWSAYNDLGWDSTQRSNAITTYSAFGPTAGGLVDFDSGLGMAAQVSVTITGGVAAYYANPATPQGGSDADAVFNGKVNCDGYLHFTTGTVTFAFSHLEPDQRYTLVLYGSRGLTNIQYQTRWTDITLSGVVSFTNHSSAGVEVATRTLPGDTGRDYAANVAGRVWRFDAINPGADGAMQLTVTGNGQGSYLNDFLFQMTAGSGNSSYPVSLGPPDKRQGHACSRRTGLVISEIMYHPPEPYGDQLEFVELFNSESWPEDLGGWRLAGDIAYTFPPGTVLLARGYLVVAKDPSFLQSFPACAGVSNVLGPYSNSLPDAGGLVRLRHPMNAVLLEVNYANKPPWPVAADGAGHSLVLACPDYGEGAARAWAPSVTRFGNPGAPNRSLAASYALANVCLNEVLAHTDPPLEDFLELYNRGTTPVDISGCYLSDSASHLMKYQIPPGAPLPPGGGRSFRAGTLGLALSMHGDEVFLLNPSGDLVLDAVSFEAQEPAVSVGRFPDGAPDFYPLTAITEGSPNRATRPRDPAIIINEIMYHPASDDDNDQYVELYNKGSNSVNVSGWRFTAGISFQFPSGTMRWPIRSRPASTAD